MPSSVDSAPVTHSGRSLLLSAGLMTGSNLIAQVFAYGSLVLLARLLSPANFGTVALASAIISVGVLFVDQGTWGAVIVERRLVRSALERAFQRCMAVAVVLAVVMAATSGPVIHHFAEGGHPAVLAAIALCLPLHAVAVVPTALLQRSMQFRRLAGINAVANIASALIAIGLALMGAGVWALVARQILLFGLLAVLSALLCLPALRSHAPETDEPAPLIGSSVGGEWWFFSFSVIYALTCSLDKFVVGLFGDAAVVGLYAIAATIAMAPWTQFSAQAGQVLFAASASHPDSFARRTEQSVRLMALMMLPLLPVGALLAPVVLPAALGAKWEPIVPVFQVLLVVGVGNAIVNCIAEPLTGKGFMPFRARIMAGQAVATAVALVLFVHAGGMRGAALAHLVVFVPYAAIYFTLGARRAQTTPTALWHCVRPGLAVLALQSLVSGAALAGLRGAGVPAAPSAWVAAAFGVLAATPPLVWAVRRMPAA